LAHLCDFKSKKAMDVWVAEKRKTIKKTILKKKDLLLLPETLSRHGSVLPGG